MKNFPIQFEGKIFWISRSIAVVGCIFTRDLNNELLILINKRGKGCPDFVGYWNVPCGYLDFDETTREACVREINEETNLSVNPKDLHLFGINDDPSEARQNVTLRYWSFKEVYAGQTIYAKGFEKDEVEDVSWIPVSKIDEYEFAFGQDKLIKDVVLNTPALKYLLDQKTIYKFNNDIYSN